MISRVCAARVGLAAMAWVAAVGSASAAAPVEAGRPAETTMAEARLKPSQGKPKKQKKEAAAPATRSCYVGDLPGISRGCYLDVRSSEMWRRQGGTPFSLDSVVQAQRAWEVQSAESKARAEAAAEAAYQECVSTSKKRCRRKEEAVKQPPEPAKAIPSSGDATVDGIRTGYVRHLANPIRPTGWDAMVEAIRSEPDEMRKLRLADGFVNGAFPYYRRLTDPKGKRLDRSRDTRWFGDWTQTPSVAFRWDGDCRDYSTSKLYLLLDAGFPADRLALTILLPTEVAGSDGIPADKDILHVVLAASTAGGTVVLDQVRRDGGATMFPLADRKKWSIASRGVLWAGNAAGGRWYSPAGPGGTAVAKAAGQLPVADDAQ